MPFVLDILLLLSIPAILYRLYQFKLNIEAARSTGLPYFLAPVAFLETGWLCCEPVLYPFLKLLPRRATSPWLPLASLLEIWRAGHLPFEQAGCDTFIIVTPWGNNFWSCDAQVNEQILSPERGRDFPKATELLGVMRSWGPALAATEGDEAKLYRAITRPCFNEDTHRRVWDYSVRRAGELLTVRDSKQDSFWSTKDLVGTCKEFTLSVICAVCYDRELDAKENLKIPSGFEMPFSTAVTLAFHYMFMIFLIPKVLLKHLPIKKFNMAYMAFDNWSKYLAGMRLDVMDKKAHGQAVTSSSDILGTIVESQFSNPGMTLAAVYGNLSNFVVAGHETSANILAFIIALLALHPEIQREMRNEIVRHLGPDRISQPASWSYERDLTPLINGLVGAVINETLRLFPLSPTTTRKVASPQSLMINSRPCVIPSNTRCFPNFPATHTNPRYWQKSSSKASDRIVDNPKLAQSEIGSVPSDEYIMAHKVHSWEPKRWIESNDSTSGEHVPKLKIPEPGTFTPFSKGPRGCLGTRFARVELAAFIIRTFAEYSIVPDIEAYGGTENESDSIMAWNKVMRQITTEATTSLTYKPGNDIRLRALPLFADTVPGNVTN